MRIYAGVFASFFMLYLSAFADNENTPQQGIRFDEPNYIITGFGGHGRNSANQMLANENNQVKLKISLNYKLIGHQTDRTGIFFGYTQNSYWNVYDNSSPFLDNDYRPQIFVQLDGKTYNPEDIAAPSFRLAVVHESNGMSGLADRSWNRITSGIEFGKYNENGFNANLTMWRVFHQGDLNRDLRRYAGDGEIRFGYYFKDCENEVDMGFSLTAHYRCQNTDFTSTELTFYINPFADQQSMWRWIPAFTTQYFRGTGENLLNYKTFSRTLRFGLMFM